MTSHAACVYPLKKHGVSDDGVHNTMKRVALGIDKWIKLISKDILYYTKVFLLNAQNKTLNFLQVILYNLIMQNCTFWDCWIKVSAY